MLFFLAPAIFFYMKRHFWESFGTKKYSKQSQPVATGITRVRSILIAAILLTMINNGLLTILQSITIMNSTQFVSFGLLRLIMLGAGFLGYLWFDFLTYHASGQSVLDDNMSILDYLKEHTQPNMNAVQLLDTAKHHFHRIHNKETHHLLEDVMTVYSMSLLYIFLMWSWAIIVVMEVSGIQLTFLMIISGLTVFYAGWIYPLNNIPMYSRIASVLFLTSFISSLLVRYATSGMDVHSYHIIVFLDILYSLFLSIATFPLVRELYHA